MRLANFLTIITFLFALSSAPSAPTETETETEEEAVPSIFEVLTVIPLPSAPVAAPFFGSDDTLYVLVEEGRLLTFSPDRDEAPPIELSPVPAGNIFPMGDELIYADREGGLVLFDLGRKEIKERLENAGFKAVRLRDRNAWYAALSRKEYEQMKGPLYPQMLSLLGREHADRYVEIWRAMTIVIESGELRPHHLRAVKSLKQ